MKVLYDHQAFTFQHFGGVSRCFCELIRRFPQNVKYEISILQSSNEHLLQSNLVGQIPPASYDKQIYLQRFHFRGRNRLWDKVLMNWPWFQPAEKQNMKWSIEKIKKGNWDVFHPTFFDPYFLPYIGEKPYVITVHDMISELYSGFEAQAKNKAQVVKRASAIVAVSENTKRDLCELLNVPESKVHVIYHGGPKQETISEVPLVEGKYILYVGNREKYKLFNKTLLAFSMFHNQHQDVKLVCTGKLFTLDENKLMRRIGVEDNVIHRSPSDDELKNLYAYAMAFIYPSEYEGFGMPILEAYAYGCPVLLNRKSCFPEIAGDVALYFDTDEEVSIVDSMNDIYNCSESQHTNLIERGYKRLADFSWEKSATQLIKLYESVI